MHEVLKSGFGTALGKVKNLGGVSGHSGSAYQGFCVKRELPRATQVSFARVRVSLDYNQSRPAKSEMSVDRNVTARRRATSSEQQ
jgi:hypothetical protein